MIELTSGVPEGVRLWQVDLDVYATTVALDGLSVAERARAARMIFARDARRYLAGRHALRCVLGRVTGLPPDGIPIGVDAVGKPCWAAAAGVEFNLSHSEQIGLMGVSGGDFAIGVDVEVVRPIAEMSDLASSHFSAEERERWLATALHERETAFFGFWVRKESCLKALGVGLAAEPSSIDVSENSCAAQVRVPLGAAHCEVSVYAVNIGSGAVAAVALARPAAVTRAREFFQST